MAKAATITSTQASVVLTLSHEEAIYIVALLGVHSTERARQEIRAGTGQWRAEALRFLENLQRDPNWELYSALGSVLP